MLISLSQIVLFSSSQFAYYILGYFFLVAFMYVTFSQIFKFIDKYRNETIITIFYVSLQFRFLLIPASFLLSTNNIAQVLIPIVINTVCLTLLIMQVAMKEITSFFETIYYFVQLTGFLIVQFYLYFAYLTPKYI